MSGSSKIQYIKFLHNQIWRINFLCNITGYLHSHSTEDLPEHKIPLFHIPTSKRENNFHHFFIGATLRVKTSHVMQAVVLYFKTESP